MSKKSDQSQPTTRTLVGYCDDCERELRREIEVSGMALGTMTGSVRCSECRSTTHCSAAGQSQSYPVAVMFTDSGAREIDQEMIA